MARFTHGRERSRAIARLRVLPAALLLAVGVVLAALLWPVLARAVAVWSTNEELRFGFALPPLALVLIWWRRGPLRAALAQRNGCGARAGLVVVLGALLAYVVCQRLAATSPAAWAAGLVLWGVAVYLGGWHVGRVLAFPTGLVAFGLGLQPTLIAPVGFALQGITAGGAALLGHGLGLPVVREGLVLRTFGPGGPAAFVVAEPCSGMNSLLALLGLAALWLHLVAGTLPARLAVVLSVPMLVVAANTIRVALVLLVGTRFGQEVALGFFHGASSLVLFGLALAGLVFVSRVTGCRPLDAA